MKKLPAFLRAKGKKMGPEGSPKEEATESMSEARAEGDKPKKKGKKSVPAAGY